jgi:phosphoglycerate dehydrogenase-like enzyme
LPHVWFERVVLPEYAHAVEARVTVLGPTHPDERRAGLSSAVGVVAGAGRYDAEFMALAPMLKVIARTGIGYDLVDLGEATRRGILVCNTPDGPTISTAEHAATLMLTVAKGVKHSELALRAEGVDLYARHEGVELHGKALGLVGYGRIGRRFAAIARGLGMRILVFDPYLALDAIEADVVRAGSLIELLAGADVVSVHLPLTNESRAMFGFREFDAMKPGSVFINTARGGLVDGDALLAAIDTGHLFGAGVDVTDPEPLPGTHPLLHRKNVVVTPHVASATKEGKARLFWGAFEQVLAVLDGNRPEHLVNEDAWSRVVADTTATARG